MLKTCQTGPTPGHYDNEDLFSTLLDMLEPAPVKRFSIPKSRLMLLYIALSLAWQQSEVQP